ncbi:MAG TPA: hypothetical protein DCK78_07445 [Paenibacillus lactis]|nr:hypothetical protein [Paenibacillus lactis]
MWEAEREISLQSCGMGCPSPSLLNSENLELIIPDEIFRIQSERSAFRMPPQAEYEGFPLSAKSIPILVEADAAEEVAAPLEPERAMKARVWEAEREISLQSSGMGCPSPSLLNSENWNY